MGMSVEQGNSGHGDYPLTPGDYGKPRCVTRTRTCPASTQAGFARGCRPHPGHWEALAALVGITGR
jgi:hypothetical protein